MRVEREFLIFMKIELNILERVDRGKFELGVGKIFVKEWEICIKI